MVGEGGTPLTLLAVTTQQCVMLHPPEHQALRATEQAVAQFGDLEQAIDTAAHAFVLRCKEERKARRARISSQLREVGRIDYSPFVLTYRLNRGYIELSWSEVIYRRGSSKPLMKRVPMSEGGTHMSRIIVGAHPDEVDLIRSHEIQARAYRKLWSAFILARRELGHCKKAADGVAGLDNDPMVVASR